MKRLPHCCQRFPWQRNTAGLPLINQEYLFKQTRPLLNVTSGWRPKLTGPSQLGPVSINGEVVGSNVEDEYFVIDIKSGTYEVACSPAEPSKNLPVSKQFLLRSGTYKYLACDMEQYSDSSSVKSAVAATFGLLGALIHDGTTEFRTKTSLEERPLPSGYRLSSYKKLGAIKTATTTSVQPSSIQTQEKPTQSDPVARLKELQILRQEGLISENEYRNKKKAILDQM